MLHRPVALATGNGPHYRTFALTVRANERVELLDDSLHQRVLKLKLLDLLLDFLLPSKREIQHTPVRLLIAVNCWHRCPFVLLTIACSGLAALAAEAGVSSLCCFTDLKESAMLPQPQLELAHF